jgi:hypothetical protein
LFFDQPEPRFAVAFLGNIPPELSEDNDEILAQLG